MTASICHFQVSKQQSCCNVKCLVLSFSFMRSAHIQRDHWPEWELLGIRVQQSISKWVCPGHSQFCRAILLLVPDVFFKMSLTVVFTGLICDQNSIQVLAAWTLRIKYKLVAPLEIPKDIQDFLAGLADMRGDLLETCVFLEWQLGARKGNFRQPEEILEHSGF